MFKRATLIALSLVFLAFFAVSAKIFWVSKADRDSHKKMIAYLQPSQMHNRGTTWRNRVTKQMWMSQKEQIYQYKIISEDSTLHLNQLKATDTRVIEHMRAAQCVMQHKLYYVDEAGKEVKESGSQLVYPMQEICKVDVKSGMYHYFTKNFEGIEGHIEIYKLPGHELTTSFEEGYKIMEGHCDEVSFYFIETIPNLKVKNFQAKIFGSETL